MTARRALLVAALFAAGCGNLVDGHYIGDAAIHVAAVLHGDVGPATRPIAGALWLGYGGLADPLDGIETTLLPITNVALPASFTCDVVGAPPDVGRYITADDSRIIPATMRLARLALIDDADSNGSFAIDVAGNVAPPDRLLAVAASQALLFVDAPPPDARALDDAHAFLGNWELAGHGYHVVQLDGGATMPDAAAHVIDATTPVIFTPPSLPVSW